MKLLTAVACLTFLLGISAYGNRSGGEQDSGGNANTTQSVPDSRPTGSNDAAKQQAETVDNTQAGRQTASPVQASQSPASPQPSPQATAERKIIREAEITLEVASPAEGQRKLDVITEAHGGFFITSESRLQDDASSDPQPAEIITVELSVPPSRFDAALAEIRAIASRVRTVKQTGKDITGKDNAQSKIKVTLEPPTSRDFFSGINSAFGYGLYIALAIIYFIFRLVAVLLPLLLIFVLPPVLLWRLLLHFHRQ